MSDQTIPIPKSYLEKILKPITRLTESCTLTASDDVLKTICASADNAVILYTHVKLPSKLQTPTKLNIININRLYSGLQSLGNDGTFEMLYRGNNIVCENTDSSGFKTHFKYHLVDDSIIKKCSINIQQLLGLKYDTSFSITAKQIKHILSASSFASDVTKVYISTKDGVIYADVDDRTLQNVDTFSIPITDKWGGVGLVDVFPTTVEIFKNLTVAKSDVLVKINNEFRVAIFEMEEDDNLLLKYLVSALIK